MNLTNFLKQTDALTSQYSTEQLIAFIHDIGRACPEHRRDVFLEMLKCAGRQAEKAANKAEISSQKLMEAESSSQKETKAFEELQKSDRQQPQEDKSIGNNHQ